jgi:hypothetical protein
VTTALHEHETTLGLLQARVFDGFFKGDLDAVRSAATEGVRMSPEAGDLYPLEMMTMSLAYAALIGGEQEASKPIFEDALRAARQIDDRVAEYALLDAMACIAAATKQPRLAAQLLGAAETIRVGELRLAWVGVMWPGDVARTSMASVTGTPSERSREHVTQNRRRSEREGRARRAQSSQGTVA